uniref:Reverse transcriptase domain-containing protein n=1 Tax=Tanacetum cinerariifolium TaxID=118510 RepID=A0A6L2NXW8_TANCI|nr:reverse transcriptase domain-containing protein [Tanacetum cinerariifolium]
MADNQTMEELLQEPTEGDVPNDVIRLMMFPYSLDGAARVNSYFPNNSSAIILRRRNKRRTPNVVEPALRTIVEMANNRTMEELLQVPTEGYGEAIVISEINAVHFEIKTNLLQLVQANPYHGFEKENPHTHINNFKRITLTLKFRDVPNDETFGEAWERFKEMLRVCPHHGFTELAEIDTFYNGLNDNDQDFLNVAAGENLLNDRIDKFAEQMSTLVDIFAKKVVAPAPVKAVEESCVTCGGAYAYYNCPNTESNNQVFVWRRNQSSTSGTLPSNTIPNPKGEMKSITTRSGVAYEGPLIHTLKKVLERETKETTDKEQTNFQGSITHIQPPVTPIPKPDVPKTLPKPNIPYPLRLNDQKLCEKDTNQMEKDKLFELAKITLNENCSVMLLKNLPENLEDPGKFLIPCDFPGIDVCHTLADLGASINLMPLSIYKKLSLPKLTPTRITLELADRSITRPKGVTEDVFIKVGKFHFSIDFVVVDFEADPRVPLILRRSFLRTGRALIDVYDEEITLRVNDESITFNLNQTMRYSSTYDDLSVNQIDIIDVAREEYA